MLNTVVLIVSYGPTGCPLGPPPLSSLNIQSQENSHTNPRAQGATATISLALGTNREGRERVKVKASRNQSSPIESALVCVRRNVKHRELKLPESKGSVLVTVAMAAVSTSGSTGCLVNLPPL